MKTEVQIIAEIGTSHGGDRIKAAELISAAAEAGADTAKFQAVFAEEIIHPLTGMVPLPGGPIPLYQRFKQLEQDRGFYEFLKETTEKAGLEFLCTPFGIRSAALLETLNVKVYKVASPELNHYPLLEFLKGTGKPVILSTGVSTLGDIERSLGILEEKVTLLHCVTAYPAPETDYNLNVLPSLAVLTGCPVGVSDHSPDPLLVPTLAVARGATVVEKHITLSKETRGLDDPVALIPEEFSTMCRSIRKAEKETSEEVINRMAAEKGAATVRGVLGTGRKAPAPSEAANYLRTNRSLHARRSIARGEIFTEENIALLRTEKELTVGLPPQFMDIVLGATAAREVSDGAGITWEHLLLKTPLSRPTGEP